MSAEASLGFAEGTADEVITSMPLTQQSVWDDKKNLRWVVLADALQLLAASSLDSSKPPGPESRAAGQSSAVVPWWSTLYRRPSGEVQVRDPSGSRW